jgi:GNAT superfamily N-acetyltransferase
MSTKTDEDAGRMRLIADAYRWQRRLGHVVLETPYCGIISDPACPDLWDANHADNVTANSDEAIDTVLTAMDAYLAHSNWRVVHTDAFTPEPFLARLAYLGFKERPAVIQMLSHRLTAHETSGVKIVHIDDEKGWQALTELVRRDVEEGKRTDHLDLDVDFVDSMIANYRTKAPDYRFHLAVVEGMPRGYGAMARAPNGMGMIEDLFTLQQWRRRGIATTLIAHFDHKLRASGCDAVFLGAVSREEAKLLYYKLGFRPAMLTRCWVKEVMN